VKESTRKKNSYAQLRAEEHVAAEEGTSSAAARCLEINRKRSPVKKKAEKGLGQAKVAKMRGGGTLYGTQKGAQKKEIGDLQGTRDGLYRFTKE